MCGAIFRDLQQNYRTIEWREFACGWSAAFVNITLTYPIYKIIFRQMLDGISMQSALHQLRKEGVYFLYRGMAPPLAQKSLSLSLMFGMYENVRRPLEANKMNPYLAKSIASVVSGGAEAVFTPFERVQTILSSANYHSRYRNMYHAFRCIKASYGFAEYYRGLIPILVRNGASNTMFFIARDEANKRMPKRAANSWLRQNWHNFICGAVIGAVTSSVFYPLNVVKVAMQCQLGGKYANAFVVFSQIYKERGGKLRYIYHGVEVNLIRAFIGWGVTNAAYGNMRNFFFD